MKNHPHYKYFIKNLKVLVEASRKVKNRDFKTFEEAESWILHHPDYTPLNEMSGEYTLPHLVAIKNYFL